MIYRVHYLSASFLGQTYTMGAGPEDLTANHRHLDPDYEIEVLDDDLTPQAWWQLAQAGAHAVGYAWMGVGTILGLDQGDRVIAVTPPSDWLISVSKDGTRLPTTVIARFSNKDSGEWGELRVEAMVERRR